MQPEGTGKGKGKYSREYFTSWTETCGVHEIQHKYDRLRQEAEENGTSVHDEMKKQNHGSYAEFCASCPRFRLACWPSEFGELGSGFVLYFHMLSLMMLLFLIFFLLQVYPMMQYGGKDNLVGWQFTEWLDLYNSDSAEVCRCAGKNNGLTGPSGQVDYGTSCQAWDIGSCDDTDCSAFARPGKWVCGKWCFAAKNCPAPLLDGWDVSLSNRVQVLDGSKGPQDDSYQGLVRSYSACEQDAALAAQCVGWAATNVDRAYSEEGGSGIGYVDGGDPNYADSHGWLSPGNTGPDQLADAAETISWMYYLCLVALCGLVFLAYQAMMVIDHILDADLVLPNDFAVMFEGLPITATDEKALVEWFSNNAVSGKTVEVVKVVIGWDPSQFAQCIKQLKHHKARLNELEGTGSSGPAAYCGCCFSTPKSSIDEESAEQEKASIRKQMADIQATLGSIASSAELFSSGVVVVVFRFQEDMRLCLRRWNSPYRRWFYRDGLDSACLPAGSQVWPGDKLPMFPVGDVPMARLSATRAPNPGNIHWEELGVPAAVRYQKLMKTNGVMVLIILVCLLITWSLNKVQDALRDSGEVGFGFALLTILPGLGVGVTNAAISAMASKMGAQEYHTTWTSENFSQMYKMAFGMLVNTGLVMLIVNAQPWEWYKLGGLVYDVSIFLMITSVAPAIFPLVDLGWLFKSRRRRQLTEARLEEWNAVIRRGRPTSKGMMQDYQKVLKEVEGFKLAFSPSEFKYTRRYAVALKTFMACVLFMPVSPFVSLIGFFGILLQYWVDKYVLLKWSKRPSRPIDRELALYSLHLIKCTLSILFSLSTWMFLTPSFKEKQIAFKNLWWMLALSAIYTCVLPFDVWTKPFLRCLVSKTRRTRDDMDYYQAQFMWTEEMKYHKDQFIYKKLPKSDNPEMLSPDTKAVKVETLQSSFGAALGAAGADASSAGEDLKLKGGRVVGQVGADFGGEAAEGEEGLVEEGKAGRPEPSAGGPEAAEPAADPPARPGEVEDPSLTALVPGTAEEKDKGKGKDKDKGKGKGKDEEGSLCCRRRGDDKGKGKGKKGKDKDKSKEKPHMNHWYVDGKIYDFSEWGKIHPGGNFFALTPSFQRDISPAYHAYHKDPEKLRPILAKYEVKLEGKEPRDILASDMNVPPFIVPPDFDARRDVPTYDWEKPFMKSLRKKINAPDMQKSIKRADFAFDVVGACLFVVHALVSFPALYLEALPAWLWVFLQIVIRTSLAGVGHYHCHRAKNGRTDWGDALFDMQYVGASVILADGHVMVHHMYTETPADVKRTVFNYMLTLPRLWRVPLFTAQKFAEAMTGHFNRFVVVSGGPEGAIDQPPELRRKELQLKFIRSLLVVELFFAVCCGKLWLWFAQFFLTLWVNMFQIVASHDFEVVREKQEYRNLDWGIHQVTSALDTYVTGIQVVDIFLSAGLSCHRTHHTLPYQKSGFANIISTPALRQTCEEFDVPWEPTRNLLLDRFFPLMWHYLTAPCQIPANPKPILVGGGDGLEGFLKEHLSSAGRSAAWNGITNIWNGFTGESI